MIGKRFVSVLPVAVFYAGAILFVLMPNVLTAQGAFLFEWSVSTITVVLYATLSIAALWKRPDDQRVVLFTFLGFLVSLTLLFNAIEISRDSVVMLLLHAAVYTIISPLVVHVSALIPRPHPALEDHRWILPLAYGVGIALFLAHFALSFAGATRSVILLNVVSYAVSGIVALGFLGSAARNDVAIDGRRQALVMFVGVLPWTLNLLSWLVAPSLHDSIGGQIVEPLVILLIPICFFISVIRYRLFGIGVVIRRGLIYGATAAILATAIYLIGTAGYFLARRAFGADLTFWSLAILFLLAGVVFQPLIRVMGRMIDRRFFHEKIALEAVEQSIIPELADCATVDEASQHLVRRLREALDLERVDLLLVDPTAEFYRVRASSALEGAKTPNIVLTAAEVDAWDEVHTPGLPVTPTPGDTTATLFNALETLAARHVVAIRFKDRLIGLLTLGRSQHGGELDRHDMMRLRMIARQASAMLENTRLFDLATKDPLTRLPRLQVAVERLDAELERARRRFRSFAVAMGDLDDFKKVNDTYGHQAGDAVLAAVANSLASSSRAIDLVARYGGEEFLLLFPDTDRKGAENHAEKLRRMIEELRIPVNDGARELTITISIGVCIVEREAHLGSSTHLIGCADQALYEAKRKGKNRVVVLTP